MDALEAGRKLEQESLHKYELPIARNTQVYANSQRIKPPYAKATDFCFFTPEISARIPSDTCNAFLSLVREGVLPGWIISTCPVEDFKGNSNDDPIKRPRCWMSRTVALIAPRKGKETVHAGAIMLDPLGAKPGKVTVWDVDSGQAIDVVIPESSQKFELDVVWEVLEASD